MNAIGPHAPRESTHWAKARDERAEPPAGDEQQGDGGHGERRPAPPGAAPAVSGH